MFKKLKRTAKRFCKVLFFVILGIVLLYYNGLLSRTQCLHTLEKDYVSFVLHDKRSFWSTSNNNKKGYKGVSSHLDTTGSLELSVKSFHKPTEISSEATKQPSTLPNEKRCHIPIDEPLYPLCQWKFKQFKNEWNDKCHGEKFQVNISDPCSILIYLSEVEPWCPRLPWRQGSNMTPPPQSAPATIQTDITGLEKLLQDKSFAWIRMRVRSFWSEWVDAVTELENKGNIKPRKRQRITFFFGGFAYNPNLIANAFKGGPLGELLQWSDVITSLYILGHDLILSLNLNDVVEGRIFTKHDHGCGVRDVMHVDRIFTDIVGITLIENELGPTLQNYRCKVLILDSFGTEAEFNYRYYKKQMKRSEWGNHNLLLRQFMTMYPHSPDNLFMGFAVPNAHTRSSQVQRKAKGVIYAKRPGYLEGKRKYLDILNKHIELHGTMAGDEHNIPDYIINHGVLNGSQFFELLSESKVFIGVGFPFEGPAPLDALANGCFYINPKLFPPVSRTNSHFFKSKPTYRKLTSQNPFTEEFVGKPYVHTIDIDNETEVENAIKEILASKETPSLPYQFTVEGLVQRVNVYMENLDFCNSGHQWPPKSQMKTLKGQKGESCKDVCFRNGFICEPSFFTFLHDVKLFRRLGFKCKDHMRRESIYAPSFNETDQTCILQDITILYSCVARDEHVTRICPCRTYQKEQLVKDE